jgi:hypothetical protein
MQVEAHHIRSRKGALGEIRQEELVDDASTCNPNPTPGGPGRMGGDDDTDPLACFVQALVRTVVERASYLACLCARAAGQEGGANGPEPRRDPTVDSLCRV